MTDKIADELRAAQARVDELEAGVAEAEELIRSYNEPWSSPVLAAWRVLHALLAARPPSGQRPVELTGRQRSELRNLQDAGKLWGGVPPHDADASLSYYIHKGFVTWEGDGYRITEAGRARLSQEKNNG